MIIVYTGSGKGKTSACVGQAVRAIGQDLRVVFVQFMKSNIQAGEQRILQQMLHDNFYIGGCGFFRDEAERPMHCAKASAALTWCKERLAACDMLIMDEVLYAHGKGLVQQEDLEQLFSVADTHGTHLVLSGRGLPEWLQQRADLITEMVERKHPWQQGVRAAKGIEF